MTLDLDITLQVMQTKSWRRSGSYFWASVAATLKTRQQNGSVPALWWASSRRSWCRAVLSRPSYSPQAYLTYLIFDPFFGPQGKLCSLSVKDGFSFISGPQSSD